MNTERTREIRFYTDEVGTLGFAVAPPPTHDRYIVERNPVASAKRHHRWMVVDKMHGRAVAFAPSEPAAKREVDRIVARG